MCEPAPTSSSFGADRSMISCGTGIDGCDAGRSRETHPPTRGHHDCAKLEEGAPDEEERFRGPRGRHDRDHCGDRDPMQRGRVPAPASERAMVDVRSVAMGAVAGLDELGWDLGYRVRSGRCASSSKRQQQGRRSHIDRRVHHLLADQFSLLRGRSCRCAERKGLCRGRRLGSANLFAKRRALGMAR